MEVKVALFGVTKDIIGQPEIRFSLPSPATVHTLLEQLNTDYPRLQGLSALAVAVNSEYAERDQALQTNDEIALIPPVSGG
jgi:molybdopterin synthase sulfur carrier subunit